MKKITFYSVCRSDVLTDTMGYPRVLRSFESWEAASDYEDKVKKQKSYRDSDYSIKEQSFEVFNSAKEAAFADKQTTINEALNKLTKEEREALNFDAIEEDNLEM